MYFRAGRKSQNDVSLDESPDSDGDSNSLALLGTISVEDERLHLVEMSDRYQTMYDCLSRNLSPREKHILTLRYGLNGHDPLPQREVAAELGISRSYVSRRAYCKCIEKQPASESSDVGCFRFLLVTNWLLFHQIGNGVSIEKFIDQRVKCLPHGQRPAIGRARTGGSITP